MKALDRLTGALTARGCTGRGSSWQCPAHDDRSPSLSVKANTAGDGVIVFCHGGCATADVMAALGLGLGDLYDEPRTERPRKPMRPKHVAAYPYCDENAEVLFEVRRFEPGPKGTTKTFRQYDASGKPSVKGVRRVPYNLPAVLEAAASGAIVYNTEGEKDADRLTSLGCVATTNAGGALKWLDEYSTYFVGVAEVRMIRDRDDAGHRHADQVAASLRRAGVPVRVFEAAHGKDVTDHLNHGLVIDDLVEVGREEHATSGDGAEPSPDDALIPEPTNPMAVARALAPAWCSGDLFTLRHWRGQWMRWERSHWRELDDQEMRAALYKCLEHATYVHAGIKGEEIRPWSPTMRKVADLMQATAAVTHLPPFTDTPEWIEAPRDALSRDSRHSTTHGKISPIVACENGLLRVSDRQLLDLTPAFFNLVSVPFDYDPTATAPAWEAFLKQVWPDDETSIEALQEWFGYILGGDTSQQKIMLVVGPTRSGKGTIARVLGGLVGRGNMAGPTLASLATNFGLSPLLGRSLAVISDARLAGRDGHQVVERLLTISGEDTIDVDRKYKDPWTGKLPTRLMILSNELPNFGDASGVIARRFVVLNMQASWLGKEDTNLTDRLTAEMPGILNWALDGLARLEHRGRITEPPASAEAVVTMQDTASPTSAFVRECCDVGADCEVPIDALWSAWRIWAEDSGIRSSTKQMFGRNLQSVVPQARRTRPREGGKQVPTYAGLGLKSQRNGAPAGA